MKIKCPECGGNKRVPHPDFRFDRNWQKLDSASITCPTCNGTGIVNSEPVDEIREAFEKHIENYCKNYCGGTGEESCTYENRKKSQIDFCFDDIAFEEYAIIYTSVTAQQAERINELQEEIDSAIKMRDNFGRDIDELEQQIESMKCCGNCDYIDCCDKYELGDEICDNWKRRDK